MEDKILWKLRDKRGIQLEKPISHLEGSNIFQFVNERSQLSLGVFQSCLDSPCSVVRATVRLGAEASLEYNIWPEVATQSQIADRMSKIINK